MKDLAWFTETLENPDQRVIIDYLDGLIMGIHPHIRRTFRYNIPFYDIHTWICYLNPLKKKGVELCFIRGKELINNQGLLKNKGRKTISGITLSSDEDFPEDEIIAILLDAIALDEHYAKRKEKR